MISSALIKRQNDIAKKEGRLFSYKLNDMWYRNRVWNQYIKNIGATDNVSARFLERYLNRIGISKEYASALEIFDLQQYKVIKNAAKVKNALREKIKLPFIFVACKN